MRRLEVLRLATNWADAVQQFLTQQVILLIPCLSTMTSSSNKLHTCVLVLLNAVTTNNKQHPRLMTLNPGLPGETAPKIYNSNPAHCPYHYYCQCNSFWSFPLHLPQVVWLVFNGTFSTNRLYEIILCRAEEKTHNKTIHSSKIHIEALFDLVLVDIISWTQTGVIRGVFLANQLASNWQVLYILHSIFILYLEYEFHNK